MSQSNIRILLILFAVLILGGVGLYVFKPNMDDKKSFDNEITALETKYNELKAQEIHRDEYLAKIDEYNAEFDKKVAIFPATLDQEISVMFMKGIEKDEGNLQMNVNSVGLGKEELFYTLGTGGAADVAATATTDTTAEAVPATGDVYECYAASFPINYEGSYEGIKDLVDYIMSYKYRMNVSNLNITYNSEEDIYTGVITLNAYCVSGNGREADTIDTDVRNGVDNIFLGGSDAAAPSSTTSATSSNAAVTITLNNANNDAAEGVIVSGKDASDITFADNKVTDVDVTVSANDDGSYTVEYGIGSDTDKVTVDKDATSINIYVKSNERADADDANGVKLNVKNDTEISVNVTVKGDDEKSPRFTMGNKTGSVKVN